MRLIRNLIPLLMMLYSTACTSSPSSSDFNVFWENFRNFSLKSDYTSLIHITRFPLEVKGVDDSEPKQYIDKKIFPDVFRKILSQPIYEFKGNDVVEMTLMDKINERKTPTPETTTNDMEIRIDQFVFQKIDSRWLLIRAYLENQ